MVDLKAIQLPKITAPDISFSNRPYYTLWYISEKYTYRLDANRKGEVIGKLETIEEGCETIKELPDFLEQLLAEATIVGRKIWLLYEKLPTHVLNVPSLQVDGVEDEMLTEVLKFEHEALTGASMTDMHLAFTLLKSEDDLSFYWLNYLPKEIFAYIVKKLKKKHCKLVGLAHPGGLPLPLDDHQVAKSWLRVESWANAVFAFLFKKGEITAFQILHPSEQTESWQTELDEFILNSGSVERSESFQNSMATPLPELTAHYSLSDNNTLLHSWLAEWLSILTDKDQGSVPLIKIPPHAHHEMVLTISYAFGALAFCSLLYGWNFYQINDYKNKTAALTKLEADIAGLNKGISADKTKRNNLSADINSLKGDLRAIPKVLDALQVRPMEILQKLAEGRPEDLVIEAISVVPEQIIIKGVTRQPELPNQLANYLEKNIVKLGFKVHSPTKVDMVLFDRGGPWQFEIQLQDLGLKGFSNLKESK